MKQIYLVVEGRTEEAFVKKVMQPYYSPLEIYFTPIIVQTSNNQKGGASSYGKIKRDIERYCRQHNRKGCYVSTLFDLYALPKDFPGKSAPAFTAQSSGWQKATFLQTKLEEDIAQRHFIANLLVHEFEALLLAKPDAFSLWMDRKVVQQLQNLCQKETPEEINDSPQTAPSKRILRLFPGYQKVHMGSSIAADIGLNTIREKCPHFAAWLQRLEQL